MPSHSIYFPDLGPARAGAVLTVGGEEAHHALRVKRMEVGDQVALMNGSGIVAECRIAGSRKVRGEWELDLEVLEVREVPGPRPVLHVLSAAPKGDRIEQIVEGLSQVGAASWGVLNSKRTVVEPRQGKMERLERTAIEAMKQCGRGTRLEIVGTQTLDDALHRQGRVVIADGSGEAYQPGDAEQVLLLVGPEGGWAPEELQLARARGAAVCRFGPHVMRIETAAVVAAGIIMSAAKSA